MAKLLLINGPNLNLLGVREPHHYGSTGLDAIVESVQTLAQEHGHQLSHLQSNAEHVLVERVHQAMAEGVDFILINPAAFTHTSVALRDALAATRIPFIEVHLSNVHAREAFRHHSYFSDLAIGVIAGLGAKGYELALVAAMEKLSNQ